MLPRAYAYLAGAIATEVAGTSVLKLSDGFENLLPAAVAVTAYVVSFYFVAQALTDLPVGLVYATWSAVGIVSLALVGVVAFDEQLDATGVLGMALVIAGIVVLNVYSDAYSPVA